MKTLYNSSTLQIKHNWLFDNPLHLIRKKDWFYMVNYAIIENKAYLHVRIFGLRSIWKIKWI